MGELRELRKRVRDAKRAEKEAGRVYTEASNKIQAVLARAESEALSEYNKDTAPFLKIYKIAVGTAFKRAQDEAIKIGATLGVRDNEAYQERLQAEKELREAEGRIKEVEAR